MARPKTIAFIAALFWTSWINMPHAASSSIPRSYYYFAVRNMDNSSVYADITPDSLAELLAQGVRPRDLLVPLARHGSEATLASLLTQPLPRAETQQALINAVTFKKSISVLQALAHLSPPGQYTLDKALARAYDTENQPVAAWLEGLGANPQSAVLGMRSSHALAARLRALTDPSRLLGENLLWASPELIRVILDKKAYAPAHIYKALEGRKNNNDIEALELLQTAPLKNRTYALMALGELPEGLTITEIQARLPEPDPCLDVFFPGADPETTRVRLEDYGGHYTLTGVWPDNNRLSNLLECGAEPSSGFVMEEGQEPRSQEDQRVLVRRLVKAGADLKAYNMEYRMASWGETNDLKYLVAHGQDPSALIYELSIDPLNQDAVQYLLDQGADPTALLIEAVRSRDVAVQEKALAWGADPTVGLEYSGQNYDLDAAKRMLDAGAMAEAGLHFIKEAIFAGGDPMAPGSIPFARLTVECGAIPDIALGLPAVREDIATVQWLLEKGADPSDYLYSPWDYYSIGLQGIARLIEEFTKSDKVSTRALTDAATKAREWDPPQPQVAKLYDQAAMARTQSNKKSASP